jgi:hypothetical protein
VGIGWSHYECPRKPFARWQRVDRALFTAINASPKISGGKVTGYNLTGLGAPITGAATTPSTLDFSKLTTTCPEGERFAGWVDASHIFKYVPTVSDLTVSIGGNSAALPNTPIA